MIAYSTLFCSLLWFQLHKWLHKCEEQSQRVQQRITKIIYWLIDDTYDVQEYVSQSFRRFITKVAYLLTLFKIVRVLLFTLIANLKECYAENPVESFVASCFIMSEERYQKKGEPCPLFDIFIWPVFDFIPRWKENYQYESDKHSYVESYVALETSMVPTSVTVFKQKTSIRDCVWGHALIWIKYSSIREKIW